MSPLNKRQHPRKKHFRQFGPREGQGGVVHMLVMGPERDEEEGAIGREEEGGRRKET